MTGEVLMSPDSWGMGNKMEGAESVKHIWEIKLVSNYEEFCILLKRIHYRPSVRCMK